MTVFLKCANCGLLLFEQRCTPGNETPLYRDAEKLRGYGDAQARKLHADLLDMPATIEITAATINVHFHRRAHLPIVISSGLLDKPVAVPWRNDRKLRLTA